MKKTIGCVALLVLSMCLTGSSALAGGGKGQGPCADDVARLCGEVSSKAEARQCLSENEGALSAQCSEKIGKRKAKFEALKNACSADAETYCSGLEGPALRQCFKANKENLSENCKSGLKKLRKHKKSKKKKQARRAIKAACGEEIKGYCGGVERGEGRMKQCIESHMGDFSSTCVEALEAARARRN